MGTVRVHQLLHGYKHGHELLSGSIRLGAPDADLITRLSDLSGTLSSDVRWASYLTVYPLPSGQFQAIARTWPDVHAARTGCVHTHTILVPSTDWGRLRHPAAVEGLFKAPLGQSTENYRTELELGDEEVPTPQGAGETASSPLLLECVSRYFGEGVRPLVWFGERDSDWLAWKIVRSLWPRLRVQFACCTFSLQPRNLEARPFDLLFAPPSVYSRFNKFAPSQIVDSPSSTDKAPIGPSEPWCQEWATVVASGKDCNESLGALSSLWCELGEDPTSIRRVYLVNELRDRARESPTAAIGVIDVVESVAPSSDRALQLKSSVIRDAIGVAQRGSATDEAVRCLRLVDDRLRRPAFHKVASGVWADLSTAVACNARRSPEFVLQAGESLLMQYGEHTESAFLEGLFSGLDDLARKDPVQLQVLHRFSDIAPQIIAWRPGLAAAYLRFANRAAEGGEVRKELLAWVTAQHDPAAHAALRTALLPLLGHDRDVELVAALLCDLPEEDAPSTLDALCQATHGFEVEPVRRVVEELVAKRFPATTRQWAASSSMRSSGIATLVAACYTETPSGLTGLLADQQLSATQKPEVIASYLRLLGRTWFPDWLRNYAAENPDLLLQLLARGAETTSSVSHEIIRLLQEARPIPLLATPGLATQIESMMTMPFIDGVVNMAMKSAISSRIQGSMSAEESQLWLSHTFVTSWLRRVSSHDLETLLAQYSAREAEPWVRQWEWIATAPRPLFDRHPPVLQRVIDALLSSVQWSWPEATAQYWAAIVRRSRAEADSQMHLQLCVQALRCGFRNTRCPLGPVVTEAFLDVYRAVTGGGEVPPETGSLFGVFDWDKGKELRRALVESFMDSKWPPGGLALAVREPWLLRKIVKRVSRCWRGPEYLQSMVADLSTQLTPEGRALHKVLRDLVHGGDFNEDWD